MNLSVSVVLSSAKYAKASAAGCRDSKTLLSLGRNSETNANAEDLNANEEGLNANTEDT